MQGLSVIYSSYIKTNKNFDVFVELEIVIVMTIVRGKFSEYAIYVLVVADIV